MRPAHRLRCGDDHRSRLPPVRHARSAGRRPRRRLDDLGRRRTGVPRCGGRRDRRQRRPRPARDRRGDGRAGRPRGIRPRERVHVRTARALRACPSAAHLPLDGAVIYPVSGGSEAIETALKLARSYHIARGEPDRWIVFGRWGSYHGNTLGALDLSGRKPLRRPYEGWLGRFRHLSAAYPYRAGDPGANALVDRRRAGPGARGGHRGGRPRDGRRVRRRADRRRDPGGGGPARRLLAEDRRGLPPPRRAAHRRRGHDRVRADGPLVRARSLGRPAGPARGREGRDVGLLAVRVRGGLGRRPRGGRDRARASSTGSPTRTARWPPRSPTRSCASSRTRISSRPVPRRASGSGPGSCEALGCAPERRRDPRSWPARRHGVRRGPRVADAVPAQRPPDRGRSSGARASVASWSTRGPATRMARTATRSCWGRRSSSRTTSWAGSWRCCAEVIPAAVAGLGRRRPRRVSDGG